MYTTTVISIYHFISHKYTHFTVCWDSFDADEIWNHARDQNSRSKSASNGNPQQDTLTSTEESNELIGNIHISEQFLKVAQDLDVVEIKTPEDIYK